LQKGLDLTNSKKQEELATGLRNTCWIKCNKHGFKVIKLQLMVEVEKSFEVSWKDKPLRIKSSYPITKEIRF
jgi:hypothetical protein